MTTSKFVIGKWLDKKHRARRKTAIFYISSAPGPGKQPIYLQGRVPAVAFLRIEMFNGTLSQALAAAKPEKGESVMNTHKVTL